MKPLLVIGDSLLDRDVIGSVQRVCPDAPVPVLDEQAVSARPGGAALAAALAASDGREVTLLTALGDDAPGFELAALLAQTDVEVIDMGLHGATPEKLRMRAAGQSLLRLDRGGEPAAIGDLSAAGRAAIGWAEAILVADYGRGLAAHPGVRAALQSACSEKPIVWDPHPRGAVPVKGVALATPNEAESAAFAGDGTAAERGMGERGMVERGMGERGMVECGMGERGMLLARNWGASHVCVTRGAAGALLCTPDRVVCAIPAPTIAHGDSCGAGDRFSSTVAGALADGREVESAVRDGVEQASAFVAGGGEQLALALAHQTRARGGTVVATGGCFDLLHAGHVQMLQAARALGDCLIVCMNSDASVKRLKGPARPVVAQADRAAVLHALACVDAVMVFDQDTPVQALARLRPHVWAKGGDYRAEELPERAPLESWGGHVVTLPYIEGHSTTGLLKEVAFRVAG